MPRLKMFVRRLQKPLILVLLWALSIPLCLSQTAGRVENVQPGNVLALVSSVLQAHHHGLQKVEIGTNDLISNYEEFRAHLLPYRAHFRFHLEGNALFVTMEDLESPGNGTWNRSLIPANAAEAKLIAQMVDQLNAANQQLAKSPVPPRPTPGAGSDTSGPAVSPGATVPDSGHELRIQPSTLRATPRLEQAKPLVFDPSAVFLDTPFERSRITRCAEGMCAIRKNGLWGFVDYQGNLVLDFRYHTPGSIFPPYFSHGICMVSAVDSNNREVAGYIFIDKKGNTLFGKKVFHSARPFLGEVTTVSLSEMVSGMYVPAVLDIQGHILRTAPPSNVPADEDFHDGLIPAAEPISRGLHVGFRNTKMQWVIQPTYSQLQAFSEGIAWVQTRPEGGEPKWGAINTEGKVIIPPVFSTMPEPFSEGLATVTCTDRRKGYVDATGTLVIPCQYDAASRFVHGHAYVRERNPSDPQRFYLFPLLIDKKGKIIFHFREDDFKLGELREDGLYPFTGAKGTGLLDGDWNIVVSPFYGAIGLFPADGDPDGLAWATHSDQGGDHQGFINRRGEFVLLQQKSLF